MTQREYIEHVKGRAREYVGQGDYRAAVVVMITDLPRVGVLVLPEMSSWAMKAAADRDEPSVIRFIEGFGDE